MSKPMYKKIMEMSWEEIARLQSNRTELVRLYNALRRSYAQRMGQFRRAGETSYAADTYMYIRPGKKDEQAVEREKINTDTASPQRIYAEIISLKKFFMAESSTVEGARRINREQDERIFGKDSIETLSPSERKEFWRVFDEWQKKKYSQIVGSNRLQVLMGDLIIGGGKIPDRFSNFNELGLGDKIQALLDYNEYIESGGEMDESIYEQLGNYFDT